MNAADEAAPTATPGEHLVALGELAVGACLLHDTLAQVARELGVEEPSDVTHRALSARIDDAVSHRGTPPWSDPRATPAAVREWTTAAVAALDACAARTRAVATRPAAPLDPDAALRGERVPLRPDDLRGLAGGCAALAGKGRQLVDALALTVASGGTQHGYHHNAALLHRVLTDPSGDPGFRPRAALDG
ncbi:hypothetical protein [Kineococcus glutinatus]|uniref:DUF222 domain-containing protein n=1 Tax=Kineococcus glutinatus TaxID=1070872 RepID=A0ABP9I1F3_9ACTN